MRFLLILVAGLLVITKVYALDAAVSNNTLQPFKTDGCTNWFDGYPKQPYLWRHCCVAHDKLYWLGGTEEQRRVADEGLRMCVSAAGGAWVGNYMHFFVRLGGSPYFNTGYRWGYGWSYREDDAVRGYKLPTLSEQQQIDLLGALADKTVEEDSARFPSANHTGE